MLSPYNLTNHDSSLFNHPVAHWTLAKSRTYGLTLPVWMFKSIALAFPFSISFAARRARRSGNLALRENQDSPPPEQLLQAAWQQQRLLRENMQTLDGGALRVLHPGFKNFEAGPDFHGAVIQLGSHPPITGDVEVDLRPNGWRAHGHDRNPNFKNVVLHVIWDGKNPAVPGMPTLVLRGILDAPVDDLASSLGPDSFKSLPEEMRGQCCAPLRDLSSESLTALLCQSAQNRWQGKALQFQARARQVGWERSLWEGLFRALGYKQNVWPMQNLAESLPQWLSPASSSLVYQARLFGISGLLPLELTRTQAGADTYLRRVWDLWWREREQFADCLLPRGLWRFNSLRPANHPQRRLALAAHWLASGNLLARLEKWFVASIPNAQLLSSLLDVLQVGKDDFWSWHWTFRSARLTRPQPLLGAARVTDLAVNVILPWFWMRAVEGGNDSLQKVAERRYLAWPAAEDNRLLRQGRQRLLGGTNASAIKSAATQQGLLQILRDYCEHSNATCENCQFPELVRDWKREK